MPYLGQIACSSPAGTPAPTRWASLATAELRALKLGERHGQLQLTALANENERLERDLATTKAAKSQAGLGAFIRLAVVVLVVEVVVVMVGW